MRVCIVGAGNVGRSIARELITNGHDVLLIERDPHSIKSETVPDAEWLLADACEMAAASLLMDFDAIEQGIRIGAPESESWRGAFGLTVTLIWLYTNILRILSFFRN